jgi:hypothetical protein
MTNVDHVRVKDMRQHVEQPCRAHDIDWRPLLKPSTDAFAISLADCEQLDIPREIVTPPIRGPVGYATALHEIGHYLGRYQRSRCEIIRETWAWKWARSNALVWTAAMELCATSWLARCAARGRARRRGSTG